MPHPIPKLNTQKRKHHKAKSQPLTTRQPYAIHEGNHDQKNHKISSRLIKTTFNTDVCSNPRNTNTDYTVMDAPKADKRHLWAPLSGHTSDHNFAGDLKIRTNKTTNA